MLQIPKNVMQIGEVNAHTKIYMEDYVHTFLERRKKAEEYLAFGKKEERGDVLYYLIYGVEKRTDWDRGSYPYFKKYERIGTIEGPADRRVFKPVRGSSILLDGFFVFYEQNEDMQSYMIVVRENEDIAGSEEKEQVMESVRTHREQRKKELGADGAGEERLRENEKGSIWKREESRGADRARTGSPEGIVRTLQRKAKRNADFSNRKKVRAVEKTKLPAARRPKGHAWTIPDLCRAGSMVLLLVLVAFGLTSVNRYPDMKAVTELFANAVKAVRGEKDEAVAAGASVNQNGLIVEELNVEEAAEVTEAVMDETEDGEELLLAQDGSGNIRWMIGEESGQEETDMQRKEPESGAPDGNGKEKAAEVSGTQDGGGAGTEAPGTQAGGSAGAEVSGTQAGGSVGAEVSGSQAGGKDAETAANAETPSEERGEAKTEGTERTDTETAAEDMTQAISRPVSYVVKKGDSLAGIARRFYGNASMVWEICDVNHIENPDQIHPGQNILLP